jgi:hypothetical protein
VGDAGASQRIANGITHGINPDGLVMRSVSANEDRHHGGDRTLVAQVLGKRVAGGIRQWQHVLPDRLRALDRQGAGAPVDVAQLQPGDLASTQPQAKRQPHHGQQATRRRAGLLAMHHQPLDLLRGESARQCCQGPARR